MDTQTQTEIFYFSGTGNSLFVAKELQKRLVSAQLTPIVGCLESERFFSHAEVVGLVFPVHALTVPIAINKFLRNIQWPNAKYVFSIATRLGTEFYGHDVIRKIIARAGHELNSQFTLTMYSNDSRHGVYVVPEKTTIDEVQDRTIRELDEIVTIIASGESHNVADNNVSNKTSSTKVGGWLTKNIVLSAVKLAELTGGVQYFYHDDSCNNCGICEKVCLSRKILVEATGPVWKKKTLCYMCFACLNFCPMKSVQIRSIPGVRSFSTTNGRYPHPFAKVHEIESQKNLASSST